MIAVSKMRERPDVRPIHVSSTEIGAIGPTNSKTDMEPEDRRLWLHNPSEDDFSKTSMCRI
jgi:hypothetical protein